MKVTCGFVCSPVIAWYGTGVAVFRTTLGSDFTEKNITKYCAGLRSAMETVQHTLENIHCFTGLRCGSTLSVICCQLFYNVLSVMGEERQNDCRLLTVRKNNNNQTLQCLLLFFLSSFTLTHLYDDPRKASILLVGQNKERKKIQTFNPQTSEHARLS